MAQAIAAGACLLAATAATAQPCNPVIDGTYCATQMPRTNSPSQSRVTMTPIQDIGSAISSSSKFNGHARRDQLPRRLDLHRPVAPGQLQLKDMTMISARTLALAAALACLAGDAFAQDNKNRTVDQYKCREVMRDSGVNRDIAIAFLHGFLLGKSGGQSFNLDTLHTQTENFVEHCLSNPEGKAIDSMMAVKK